MGSRYGDNPVDEEKLEWQPEDVIITAPVTVIDDSIVKIPLLSPVCSACVNLSSGVDRTCAAFPDGIPLTIWEGKNKHKKPVAGDSGILFERSV